MKASETWQSARPARRPHRLRAPSQVQVPARQRLRRRRQRDQSLGHRAGRSYRPLASKSSTQRKPSPAATAPNHQQQHHHEVEHQGHGVNACIKFWCPACVSGIGKLRQQLKANNKSTKPLLMLPSSTSGFTGSLHVAPQLCVVRTARKVLSQNGYGVTSHLAPIGEYGTSCLRSLTRAANKDSNRNTAA